MIQSLRYVSFVFAEDILIAQVSGPFNIYKKNHMNTQVLLIIIGSDRTSVFFGCKYCTTNTQGFN